ncbi:MAG: PEP-CTERM sorting domain-containing protein [Planctomycetota bacterium]
MGDYPSCTIVPEPATILLLFAGGLMVSRRKRVW